MNTAAIRKLSLAISSLRSKSLAEIIKIMLKKFLIFTVLSVFLIGCQTVSESGNELENDPPNGDAVVENSNQDVENKDSKDSNRINLPKDKDLDLQANHPNGTVLRLTRITFNPDSINVDFSVTNGHKNAIELAQAKMQLKDSAGNIYNLSPPQGNPELRISAGSNVKGTLTFLGRISPDAKSISLTTNSRYTSGSNEYDSTPTMVISDIPLER